MTKVKIQPLVSRDSLANMLVKSSNEKQMQIVGRALSALLKRQTEAERNAHSTSEYNGVGFSGPDAKTGTLCAQGFIRYGTLLDWQLASWLRISNGYPRICKYAKQLNEIAIEKAQVSAAKALNDQRQNNL